jgi:beclin 1
MANDKKQTGLACQKCRTPIDIDASIDQLNPAAFKLLTGTFLCHEITTHHTNM